jgi:Dolichyl-phosphate-mannose-protein mannosyltransferase
VQLFRAPLTPLAVGLPLDLGGIVLLEIVFGLLFAVSVVAWSATALTFGRIPALASAVLLLVYPTWATLYHQASSDAVFATGLALWALVVARTLRRPSTGGFVLLGAGIAALVLIRPANQVLLPAILAPLLAAAPWRSRLTWVAVCLAAAVLPLAGWAVHNGIRYDDYVVARGGRAWVPFLRVWLADRTVAPENGPGSRRLAELVRSDVLTEEPFASLRVPLDAYLANGSNYETVRLIALSDRVLGRDSNYDVLFDSAVEAIREHPGTYARGVADVFWEFLIQRPLREAVAPRAQTAPGPPAPTFERGGVVLPNPQATVLLEAVPYGFVWCASDYIDSCTVRDPALVWDDPATRVRYREVVSQVRAWDAELPTRTGRAWVTEILNRITPRFPRPALWLAVGAVALVWRRPRGWRTIVVLWSAAAAVLLIHAASQGIAPEFALPLYPLFIVTALGALAGDRSRSAAVRSEV